MLDGRGIERDSSKQNRVYLISVVLYCLKGAYSSLRRMMSAMTDMLQFCVFSSSMESCLRVLFEMGMVYQGRFIEVTCGLDTTDLGCPP